MSVKSDNDEQGSSSHEESPPITDDELSPKNKKHIEVKCGPLRAIMHADLFLCPGIHQPCIELNGEMISPKEFTVRANKDKQKDWKGSIRIGKSNLRTLMEQRSFDFYNHTALCSAKCQSRNYITPKDKGDGDSRRGSLNKTAIEQFFASHWQMNNNNNTKFANNNKPEAAAGTGLMGMSNALLSAADTAATIQQLMQLGAMGMPPSSLPSSLPSTLPSTLPPVSTAPSLPTLPSTLPPTLATTTAVTVKEEELVDVDDTMETTQEPTLETVQSMVDNDPSSLFSQLQQTRLMDEVLGDVSRAVDRVRFQHGPVKKEVCSALCSLITHLDLTPSLHERLRTAQANAQVAECEERKRRASDDIIYRPVAAPGYPLGHDKRPRLSYSMPSSDELMRMNQELLQQMIKSAQEQQAQSTLPPSDPPQMGLLMQMAAAQQQEQFNAQLTEALLQLK